MTTAAAISPTEEKPVKALVLDAGPLILNEPAISTLLARCEYLYSPSTVLAEIRDPAARARLQTTVSPFLTVRDPSAASMKVASDFARRTGDLAVLSATDLHVIALAYELECERNGGDWRLRKTPGQKGLNGKPPTEQEGLEQAETGGDEGQREDLATQNTAIEGDEQSEQKSEQVESQTVEEEGREASEAIARLKVEDQKGPLEEDTKVVSAEAQAVDSKQAIESQSEENKVDESSSTANATIDDNEIPGSDGGNDSGNSEGGGDDSSDGEWITPSNLAKRIAADSGTSPLTSDPSSSSAKAKAPTILQVATLTTDFALQNVLLQMNLNLLSSRLQRVRQVRSHVLRCHACFNVHRDLTRQFCSRCGQPALTRVACSSTADGGGLILHLKRNWQYNKRGDRYSVPKPVGSTASGKGVRGGGKGGWGNGLILAEDQKEYVRATATRGRGRKEKSGLDLDELPSILTGRRDLPGSGGGKPKIGAGRNVNSKKR